MISAGNDIVSLTATNVTRTKLPEFYTKIISPAEHALYETLDHDALSFDHFVWLLWSVKESAYKYLRRLNQDVVFTPVKFEVQRVEIPGGYQLDAFGKEEFTHQGFGGMVTLDGAVIHEGVKLFFKTLIYREFVASVVNANDNFGDIHWGIRRVGDTGPKEQSAAVRQFALESLTGILENATLRIEKNACDAPVVFDSGAELEAAVSLSLSHHGEWVGYAVKMH